jgi:putative ABC transport system permease protein
VNIGMLAVRNVGRNKFRTVLTLFGVSIAILLFIVMRTVVSSWTVAADYAAKDRVATRHKVSFVMQLPLRYVEEVRQIPGITQVAQANWFGAKDPNHPNDFFANISVVPADFLQVYDEIQVPPAQREAWLQTKNGALVGSALAKQLGWSVGDRVTLQGTIYPGDWEFVISGIYTSSRKSIDQSTFWLRWDYVNDALPEQRKDMVGWIVSRIDNPARAGEISTSIDKHFDEKDLQTLSMSERAMNTSFLGMFSAVLKMIDIVSVIMLGIMVLILGNTVAMGVRERTHEYGVLRAIGFLPGHIRAFVYGEALTIGILGGVLGVGFAFFIVDQVLARVIEENMGGIFPYFRVEPLTIAWALILSAVLGVAAAGIPAHLAAKLKVVDSLRQAG